MSVIFFKSDEGARHPGFAHKYDAGIDLYALPETDVSIISFKPFEVKLIHTGIYFKIPNNHVGIIKDRSGIALKTPLSIKAGVIDPSYRGEIGIVMQNVSNEIFDIDISNPIAQMIVCVLPTTQRLQYMPSSFDKTDRGESGFGSTDIVNDNKNDDESYDENDQKSDKSTISE